MATTLPSVKIVNLRREFPRTHDHVVQVRVSFHTVWKLLCFVLGDESSWVWVIYVMCCMVFDIWFLLHIYIYDYITKFWNLYIDMVYKRVYKQLTMQDFQKQNLFTKNVIDFLLSMRILTPLFFPFLG